MHFDCVETRGAGGGEPLEHRCDGVKARLSLCALRVRKVHVYASRTLTFDGLTGSAPASALEARRLWQKYGHQWQGPVGLISIMNTRTQRMTMKMTSQPGMLQGSKGSPFVVASQIPPHAHISLLAG